MKFRNLRSDEIDVRVQSVKEKGFILLLYKDARCDMNILDETVGCMNWQRKHSRDNANCIVEIWCDDKKQWISKEDTGTESNTEKAKGLASDSFKRSCFNWGIGRELYTSPFTWISDKSYIKNGKVFEKFSVSEIETIDGVINKLYISDSKGKQVFSFIGGKVKEKENNPSSAQDDSDFIKQIKELTDNYFGTPKGEIVDTTLEKCLKFYKVDKVEDIPKDKLKATFNKLIKSAM